MKKPGLFAALLLAMAPAAGHADGGFPNRPIKMVVAAPTGGVPDVIARLVGQHMSASLGQPIAVENKTGAGSIIALESVAKANPDGYTLLVADSSPLTINPTLYKKLPYQGMDSFEPIAFLGAAQLFLTAGPSLKANSFQEMVAQAKAAPGKLTYGTIGIGSLHHVMFEEIRRSAGIDIMHVPFREQPSAPVAAGTADMLLAGLPSIEGLVRAGRLRLLGVTSKARVAQLPDVPTLEESGLPGYVFTADIGLLAPRGTPPEHLRKLADAARQAVAQPDVRRKLADLGIVPDGRVLAEYGDYMRREIDRFGGMVQRAGLAGTQ
ncbi:tripartite tricarboxylate transporter substrate binding protein [Pigmentiphaga sp.]|uniref:Bug family tripartite tricarboxylate transporter substrate binding protein n=1 Tax=Pigmentiphaga sp. TaxID=1977564 RepID=UPI0025DFDF0C|nr:tripartite tricarboxylate transporter substrate binding protein [Pigmentiphaga sp.]